MSSIFEELGKNDYGVTKPQEIEPEQPDSGKFNQLEIVMPNDETDTGEVIFSSIEKDLTREKITNVKMADPSDLQYPNYVIDGQQLDSGKIDVFQFEALETLISDKGDTAIYFITADGNIQMIGKVVSEKFEKVIGILISKVFDGDFRFFRNYNPATADIEEITKGQFKNMRLEI